jgi:hypothetical protein
MNVFVVATVGAVLIIFITTYIIAFTPLREYIPDMPQANSSAMPPNWPLNLTHLA